MSTNKTRNGPKPQQGAMPKQKKPLETTKKETKVKVSSRIQSKRDEEEEKKRKPLKVRSTDNVKPNVNKTIPLKKSTVKSQSSRVVTTPPSKRVTKTQFFPSKNMYSNALKSDTKTSRVERNVSPDSSSTSERPRTATLRKGSIVTKNIVGPEAPKPLKEPKPEKKEPQIDYEDDFDSYESDFDEYNSSGSTISTGDTSSSTESDLEPKSITKRVSSAGTDDEKKLDSGNYEMPEPKHRQILDNIKESIEKENLIVERSRSHLGSLSDEGFEEAKSLQFINFLGAHKKYQHRKSVQLRRKRGEELLSMIRLDQYNFTLFESAPVPYDVFIKSFGKSNSVQVSVQTSEDDVDEEVQTDTIEFLNKWTQSPPFFQKLDQDEHWSLYKANYLGVGGDFSTKQEIEFNESHLDKFILNTGSLVLNLQAEANIRVDSSIDKTNIPFSSGFIRFDTHSQKILENRLMIDACFCSNKILTIHGKSPDENFEKSYVCVWNKANIDTPELFLFVYGNISCCDYIKECPNLIFAGTESGSLIVWDISESQNLHRMVGSNARSPTYSTEITASHFAKVIKIESVTSSKSDSLFAFRKAMEVCSLDEDGEIIIWSVIFRDRDQTGVVEKQGLAHWGSVILTKNSSISLKKLYPEFLDFNCTDLALSYLDSNHLYISTNYGIIVHCLAAGGKPSTKKFSPETQTGGNCLEMCPFSPEYFLAGFDNGDINFYGRFCEKPLMVLSNKSAREGQTRIEKIRWSTTRPLIFYAKDATNTIHVWNLKVSDMFPTCSVPFKNRIISMKISPVLNNSESSMLIASDDGMVYVHQFGNEHNHQSLQDFDKDKRTFLNYINRCI